ncbi:hypothetical protein [Bartonella sp. HY406]|uniref:hypothetical protein n=1 Tax=Bartonella sp. HY406 TaxID=2979331 RepID=UPI0021C906A7|nr:hypothetical protein [Bartonella sp. HY406]UXN04908.1 hypothetical protein N6B01_14480 [Bartonella sp. HY406]
MLQRFLQGFWEVLYNLFCKRSDQRYLNSKNFAVHHSLADEYGSHYQDVKKLFDCIFENRLDDFEQGYTILRKKDQLLQGGVLKSGLVWQRLGIEFGRYPLEQLQQGLAAIGKWAEEKQSAFGFGLYAYCLHHAAWTEGGDHYADEASEEEIDGYFRNIVQMETALTRDVEGKDDCLIWNLANYNYHSDGICDVKTLNKLFKKLIALDPDNLNNYCLHAFKLLPRWHGNSMRDMDNFARQAIEKTKDRFGNGVYSLIYHYQFRLADHEVEDSFCDLELLNQGFDDLYNRFGGQMIVNRQIATLDWAQDYRRAKEIIDTRLTAMTPLAWMSEDSDEGLEFARDTIAFIGLLEDDEEDN